MTILPASGAGGRSPMLLSGIVTTTISPASAASRGELARARGPSSLTSSFNVSGPRELLTTTSYPCRTASRASWLPMWPAPINPIVFAVMSPSFEVLVSPDHQEYFLPKQFRHHFVQIEPPVQPLVTACGLHANVPIADSRSTHAPVKWALAALVTSFSSSWEQWRRSAARS